MKIVWALSVAVLAFAPAWAGAAATARISDLERNVIGRADFKSASHGVVIEIHLKGLKPGPHAIFLHTTAACEPGRQFTTAGPIFSFEPDRPHGYMAKGGPRAGDLPLQYAAADGSLNASFFSSAISLGDGAKSIFDRDGVSLIVHANGDDYLSQPDGGAGARIACGSVIRTVAPGRQKSGRKHR